MKQDLSYLNKKLSVGISMNLITADQWCDILKQYSKYIHDIYFSPVDSMLFQSRRTIYDFSNTTIEQRENELKQVIESARKHNIKLKLVLNSKEVRDRFDDCVDKYKYYKDLYEIEFVTTYIEIARRIKAYDNTARIICSFNQGISSRTMLEEIIKEKLFYGIVLGERFLHDFAAFKLLNEAHVIMELLVNNGCMLNCGCFCVNNVPFCKDNYYKNLEKKGLVHLYAECSILPEELTYFYAPTNSIDIYKLSTRPIDYNEISNMMESYTTGESKSFIDKNKRNYHLYCRLTHFSPFYNDIEYNDLVEIKKEMWHNLGYL